LPVESYQRLKNW